MGSVKHLVLFHLHTNLGGAERALINILRYAQEKGVNNYLITSDKKELLGEFQKVTCKQWALHFPFPTKIKSWWHFFPFIYKVRHILKQVPTEGRVLFCGDFLPLWAVLQLKILQAPVYCLWQGEYDFSNEKDTKKWLRYGANRADRLLACTPICSHANSLKILKQEIRPLDPLVDESRFDPKIYKALRLEIRQALDLDPEERVAFCFGRIGEGKGQLWLIEQFLKQKQLYENWKLVVAGPVTQDQDSVRLQRLTQEDPKKRFLFLGPRNDIPQLLAACDLVLFPGLCAESFGLAAAETLCMTVPFLSMAVGAVPLVIGSEYKGLIPTYNRETLLQRWEELTSEEARSVLTTDVRKHRDIFIANYGKAAWQNKIEENLLSLDSYYTHSEFYL